MTVGGTATVSANLVKNSDFSAGLTNWNTYQIQGTANFYPYSYVGYNSPSALDVLTSSNYYYTRIAEFAQEITGAVVGQTYNLTFYQGRSTNATSYDYPSISASIGSVGVGGTGCSSTGCPLAGESGSVYQQFTRIFTATATSFNLSVEVVWSYRVFGDGLLFSDFSIVPIN